jgi:hypothetical protein
LWTTLQREPFPDGCFRSPATRPRPGDLSSAPSSEDERCGGIEGRKEFHRSWYEKRMGLIPIIVLKLTEILQIIPGMWSRLEKGLGVSTGWNCLSLYRSALERGLGLEKNTIGSSFQREVGFRNITKVNWKSPLGSPLSFLPCRVPLNHPCFLSHPGFLSFLN